ncbi:MAG: hypothetical protein WBG46_13810 [Nonlabens sp.]
MSKKIHKHQGFQVPANYFDELTDRVMNKMNEGEKSQKAPPAFKTPPNYFEHLNDRLLQTVENSDDLNLRVVYSDNDDFAQGESESVSLNAEKNNTVTLAKTMRTYALPLIGVAASLVALFTLSGNRADQNMSTELDDEILAEYVINMEDYMDQEAVEILFAESDFITETTTELNINDDAIIDYLMEEVDLNQIITE